MNKKSILKMVSIVTFALLLSIPLANAVNTVDTAVPENKGITEAQKNMEMANNTYRNVSANGSATFLRVEGYEPWAALVVNAGSPRGVDKVVLTFSNQTLRIEVTDDNHTNHVNILINKEFADKYIANSTGDIEFNMSDAVNYRGLNNTNETEKDDKNYVFHIEHFSTQVIEISNQSEDEFPPAEDGEVYKNRAKNASKNGSATFLKVEGYDPWAALIINAGNKSGIDTVTASFENRTLKIEAEDSNETNHVTILINKAFADKYLAESESDLEINISDAVNYEGLDNSNSSSGGAVYVFQVEHFSTQTINISRKPEFEPPVKGAEAFNNSVENAAAYGAATFLKVEGYEPWAALVVNAGNQTGVDSVTAEFENDTLIIEVTDSNSTNNVNILVNKEFADEYLAEAESELNISVSDAVNYEGLDNSNESAGGGAMYVFQVEHFSTQVIEMSKQVSTPDNDFEPPVDGGEAFNNQAQNAAANGAATFLRIEGYEPWAVLVVNAGDPHGVDAVTATFEDGTLRIEVTDSNTTNHVTILVNKQFADEHLAESEGDLDINVSDAVNYEGLDNSNESAGGGAMYVFQVEHFSTQSIEISSEDSLPFVSLPVFLVIAVIPVAIYSKLRKK